MISFIYMNMKEFFKDKKVAVALSGGVDSAVLLYFSKKYAKSVHAYFVKTPFQPVFELEDARRISSHFDVELTVIELNILNNKSVEENSEKRCYYCKKEIFEAIRDNAFIDKCDMICDGTNASDDINDRPGMTALRELGIVSPLRIFGVDKKTVRKIAEENDIFVSHKPSYACLATRIPFGTEITQEILDITESAENYLHFLGFSDFRVRYVDGSAKLQFTAEDVLLYKSKKETINLKLSEFYSKVNLDPKVRCTDE